MPRTTWATLALTLVTTPCFGGLIAVTPGMSGNRPLEVSLRSESPSISIEAAALVRTLGRIQDSWQHASANNPTPMPSINSLNHFRHDQTESTDERTGHQPLQLRPTATPNPTTPPGPISQSQSPHRAGSPQQSEPAFQLTAERTVPEPIMFAFVALMAPCIHSRYVSRRVKHLA